MTDREAEGRRQLAVVAAYEERYHRPCWEGREGTTPEVLDGLVELGHLSVEMSKDRTRRWFFTTDRGREALAAT